jgi:hypothetical protein
MNAADMKDPKGAFVYTLKRHLSTFMFGETSYSPCASRIASARVGAIHPQIILFRGAG